MKKIILLLFLILNVLMFENIKNIYEEKDVVDVVTQFSNSLPATVIAVIPNIEIESQEVFKVFKELTEIYDAMIFSFREDWSHQTKTYHYFVELNGKVDERLGLITEQSLEFNQNSELYYSNRSSTDPNSVHFYLLNKNVDVRLYPMSSMGGSLNSGEYTILAPTKAEVDKVVEVILDKFGGIIGNVFETSVDVAELEIEIVEKTSLDIWICLIAILLILIIYIYSETKKIAILKTLGFSFFRSIYHLFFPIFLKIILTITFVNLSLFFILIRVINERTIPIISSLINTGIQQIIGIIFIFIFCSVLLLFIPHYSLLKNFNLNYYLMKINYVMKILILIFFLPILDHHIKIIKESTFMLNQLKPLTEVEDYQTALGLKQQYASDGYNIGLYATEFYEDGNENEELLEKYDKLKEYHDGYHLLDNAGAIFCNPFLTVGGIPGLNVNENYLKKYPVIDVENKIVDISLIDDEIIYLIPVAYADHFGKDEFDLGAFGENYNTIFIQDDQFTPDYSLSRLGQDTPLVLTVFRDFAFRIDKSPFNHVYLDGEFNDVLKNTSFFDKMTIKTIGQTLDTMNLGLRNRISTSLFTLMPVFSLILVMAIQYSYFYLKVFQKQIYIKRVSGHDDFKIFFQLLMELLLNVFTVFIVALAKGLEFKVLFFIVLMDVFIYTFIVFNSRYKNFMAQ